MPLGETVTNVRAHNASPHGVQVVGSNGIIKKFDSSAPIGVASLVGTSDNVSVNDIACKQMNHPTSHVQQHDCNIEETLQQSHTSTKSSSQAKSAHLQPLSVEEHSESIVQINSYVEQRQGGLMRQANQMLLQRMARFTEEDCMRLQEEINDCRRMLVDQQLLVQPVEDSSFFRTTFCRFGKGKHERSSNTKKDHFSVATDFKSNFWTYSKVAIRQPLLSFQNEDLNHIALKMFNSILIYSQSDHDSTSEDEQVNIVQALIQKCLDNADICNEFYLQIIKQSSDHSEPNHSVNLRNWQILSIGCNLVLPKNELILRYLRTHLRKCSIDTMTEEGRYAQYCQKSLNRTIEKRARKFPPSFKEIKAICLRRLTQENVHLLNGGQRCVEFFTHSTTEDMLRIAKSKVGMRIDGRGWALFECFGFIERAMNLEEYFGDVLFKWEQYARYHSIDNELKIVFKKRLFIEPLMNIDDEVEVDLLAHQCVTSVYEGRIPLDLHLAIELCGIRAAAEGVDSQSAMRILPHNWRDRVSPDDITTVATEHLAQSTYTPADVHRLHTIFIKSCQRWPYFGATFYDVQLQSPLISAIANTNLLLAVDQHGIHLLRSFSQRISLDLECLASNSYTQISSFNTQSRYFLAVFYNPPKSGNKMVFFTKQATYIAYLIRDYMKELKILPDSVLNRCDDRRRRVRLKSSKSEDRSCKNDSVSHGPIIENSRRCHSLSRHNDRKSTSFTTTALMTSNSNHATSSNSSLAEDQKQKNDSIFALQTDAITTSVQNNVSGECTSLINSSGPGANGCHSFSDSTASDYSEFSTYRPTTLNNSAKVLEHKESLKLNNNNGGGIYNINNILHDNPSPSPPSSHRSAPVTPILRKSLNSLSNSPGHTFRNRSGRLETAL